MVTLGPQPLLGALRPYVASLVAYDVTSAPGVHRGLPGTTLTFVLPVERPIDVGWAGAPTTRRAGWSSVAGLHPAPAEIHHDGHQQGFYLELTLPASRVLLGMPAGELSGLLTDLDELAPELADLPERLHETVGWVARNHLVQHALVAALARHDAPGPRAEVGRALARLTTGAPVAEVADDVGYSRRHLGNLVRAETGLSPKEYQRVARFQGSRDRVLAAARAGTSLAEVAARSGYADQAHLAREWRELAGCPPSQWLREEFPNLQAQGPPSPPC
jgi:AraC-like DNA-binding protein